MVTNGGPFCATYYTDIFDGEDGEKEVFVGAVVPVLVHLRE